MAPMVTEEQLRAIAGTGARPDAGNVRSIVTGLAGYGARFGLDRPHRLAQFLAQLAHESGRWRYDREIWGPTPAQRRYDTRTDLGNTAAVDGDGYRNRGRGPIQVTGGDNLRRLSAWARRLFGAAAPDFFANPDTINTDPWELLSAVWYWDEGNPTGHSLNAYADDGNIEAITRKINGGLNGLADRLALYARTALVLLGYGPAEVSRFQADAGFTGRDLDGIAGAKTRAAMHAALLERGQPGVGSGQSVPAPDVAPTAASAVKPSLPPPQAAAGGAIAAAGAFAVDWRLGLLVLVLIAAAAAFMVWRMRR